MTFGLLRIKNEERWIFNAIQSIKPLCDEILVLDDGSTDRTPDFCMGIGCRVWKAPGMTEPEGKDWLLARMWEQGVRIGDTVLWLDGDEELVPEDIPNVQAAIDHGVEAAAFRIVYLWDDEKTVRVDGIYGGFTRPSFFRLTSRDLSFMRTGQGPGFHCSNVPQQLIGKAAPLPVRLLHYGYMHRRDRVLKYAYYNQKDPGNRLEDCYRHMVIGDQFPADSRFTHAGPLKLMPLADIRNSGRWYPKIEGHYDARANIFDPPEMASVLQFHKVLLNGREIRLPWYFDTREGIVKTYHEQPEYRCSQCHKELQGWPSDSAPSPDWRHLDGRPLCNGALVELAQREELDGPLMVSGVSWSLRGRVELVRR